MACIVHFLVSERYTLFFFKEKLRLVYFVLVASPSLLSESGQTDNY